MLNLTQEDRIAIQNQIEVYKQNKIANLSETPNIPLAPTGQDASAELNQAIQQEATPGKQEKRRIKNRIKGLWRSWRATALDAKSLEIEKIACQITIERAETKAKLAQIKRDKELAKAEHWLRLNKGNLEEINANTTSRPSKFWYGFRRFFHHLTKLTDNVPKIIKNLVWIGLIIVAIVLLKYFNII